MADTSKTHDVIELAKLNGKIIAVYLNDNRVHGRKPYVTEFPTYEKLEIPIGELRKHLKRKPRAKK